MVKRTLALTLALAGCAPQEGDVLIVRDAQATDADPAPDAAAGDAALTQGVCRIRGAQDGFFEAFDGEALDAARWLVAHGPVTFAAQRGDFARDNVEVRGGSLVLRVRGDLYEGPVRAVDGAGRPLASGRRSAAAVATRDL